MIELDYYRVKTRYTQVYGTNSHRAVYNWLFVGYLGLRIDRGIYRTRSDHTLAIL